MTPQQISALINSSPMNRGMDGAAWLSSPGNITISYGENVMLFQYEREGVYQFHWLQTVTKGRKAIERTLDAFDHVFSKGAHTIYGLIPDDRRDSKLMARWIGAKSLGKVRTAHGVCEMFSMTREMRERIEEC